MQPATPWDSMRLAVLTAITAYRQEMPSLCSPTQQPLRPPPSRRRSLGGSRKGRRPRVGSGCHLQSLHGAAAMLVGGCPCRSQGGADSVEVAQGLAVGADQGRLGVGEVVLAAELPD
jgi:hypothetical protein